MMRRYARLRLRLSHTAALMHAVEGLLQASELDCLFELAKSTTDGVIVEIGSYRGRSTVGLGLGSLAGHQRPIYAIEPHVAFEGVLGGQFGPADKTAFFRNIVRSGCGEIVYLINLPSAQAVKGWQHPIGLLWIDGDHRYEAVQHDFEAWLPFVLPNGRIALHDSLDPALGPYQVIQAALATERVELERIVDKITILRRS